MNGLLDEPLSLKFPGGKAFPPNSIFMGYIFLVVSIFILLIGSYIIGIIMLLLAIFMAFTTNGTEIDVDLKIIKEYTNFLGFIKTTRTFDYKKYKFITVIPHKQTTTMYARSSNSLTQSEYFFEINLLNENYRGKKELCKFKQKSFTEDLAINLSSFIKTKSKLI